MAVCGSCRYNDGSNKNWYKGYCTYWKKYVDPDSLERDCRHYESGDSGSGGCYLTSACVQARGLTDDCVELTTLRRFRDGYLRESAEGAADIEHYYASAPQIVQAINASADAETIWARVYDELVAPCVALIREGRMEDTYRHYKRYSLELESVYLT